MRRKKSRLVLGIVLLFSLVFSACSNQVSIQDEGSEDIVENNVEETIEMTEETKEVDLTEEFLQEVVVEVNQLLFQAQLASMMASNVIIEEIDFHSLEQQAYELDVNTQSLLQTADRTLTIIQKTLWVPELEDVIDSLKNDLKDLNNALMENNQEKAMAAISSAHRTEHELEHQFYNYVKNAEVKEKTFTLNKLNAVLSDMEIALIISGMIITNHIVEQIDFHALEYKADELEVYAQELMQLTDKTLKVIQGTTWAPELAEVIETLENDIIDLREALIADDQQKAIEAIKAAHATEHDLEHMFYSYLEEEKEQEPYNLSKEGLKERIKELQGLAQISQMTTANYMIEKANFHDIAHDLNNGSADTQNILRIIDQIIPIIKGTAWSIELADETDQLYDEIQKLQEAILAENVEEAATIADTIHALQHEQENAYYATMEKAANRTFSASVTNRKSVDTEENKAGITTDAQVLKVIQGDADEYEVKLDKQELEIGPITLKIINKGEMPHGVWSTGLKVNEVVGGNDEMTVTVEAEEPGTYTLMCAFPACGSPEEHASMTVTIEIK